MRVLGIETSCDETGVGLYEGTSRHDGRLIGQALYSQIGIHAPFGGVVPELASRDHVRKLLPLISQLLNEAHCTSDDIDAVAYTAGPGLMGALMVGACVAHGLSFAWNVPCVPVHHMIAHLLAVRLEDKPPEFPFLALLVSGGHTLLVEARSLDQYRVLGESLDDAAGEAFDKVAQLLDLGYPGGPAIAKIAVQAGSHNFVFPRPLLDRPGLDFSFSGLKTAVFNAWHGLPSEQQTDETRAAVAEAFQRAVVDTLVKKCQRALSQTQLSRLVIAGGVAANQQLRQTLHEVLVQQGVDVFYPRPEWCTDNGAMVAYAGWINLMSSDKTEHLLPGRKITVHPRWPFGYIAK